MQKLTNDIQPTSKYSNWVFDTKASTPHHVTVDAISQCIVEQSTWFYEITTVHITVLGSGLNI